MSLATIKLTAVLATCVVIMNATPLPSGNSRETKFLQVMVCNVYVQPAKVYALAVHVCMYAGIIQCLQFTCIVL